LRAGVRARRGATISAIVRYDPRYQMRQQRARACCFFSASPRRCAERHIENVRSQGPRRLSIRQVGGVCVSLHYAVERELVGEAHPSSRPESCNACRTRASSPRCAMFRRHSESTEQANLWQGGVRMSPMARREWCPASAPPRQAPVDSRPSSGNSGNNACRLCRRRRRQVPGYGRNLSGDCCRISPAAEVRSTCGGLELIPPRRQWNGRYQ